MNHRKESHRRHVPLCKAAKTDTCPFGKNRCWFNHEDTIANSDCFELNDNMDVDDNEQKREMIHKLF